jgi:curved DNA-binding protein
MQFKDYYQTLGVARDATAEEIKKAFRKLARKYHPDVSKEADAELRMKELNEANAVLSDPEKRAAYDQLGAASSPARISVRRRTGMRASNSPAAASRRGSRRLQRLLRRTVRPHGRRPSPRRPATGGHFQARGEDHHAKVLLDLEDAFHGATRQVSLRVPQVDAQGRVSGWRPAPSTSRFPRACARAR